MTEERVYERKFNKQRKLLSKTKFKNKIGKKQYFKAENPAS